MNTSRRFAPYRKFMFKQLPSPGYIWLAIFAIIVFFFAFSWLSGVLMPFIIAWMLAYMLNPVVRFFQHKMRIRVRVVAVVLTLFLFTACLVGLFGLVVPPLLHECSMLKEVAHNYYTTRSAGGNVPDAARKYFELLANRPELQQLLREGDLLGTLKSALPKMLAVLQSTTSAIFSFAASLIGVLYLFFLMLDYDKHTPGWSRVIPQRYRHTVKVFVRDVEHYFCGYFRGQLLIALSNCIMFTIGFLLVGYPMPVALGCFIGIISFVPYLQVAGVIPAVVLALLEAATTGANFWALMGMLLLVYLVVQIVQDVVVTPRVMGKIMGLSPAVILLSLSVGSFVLGIAGLVLALPTVTLISLYYKRHILHDPAAAAAAPLPEDED